MDSARQVIRWSIPGALLLIALASTFIAMRLAEDASLSVASEPIRENVSAAAGIALSIPLGFVVYQLYWLTYRPRRILGIVTANRGQAVLRHLSERQRTAVGAALAPILAAPRSNLAEGQEDRIRGLTWTMAWGTLSGQVLLDDVWSTPPTAARRSRLSRTVGGLHLVAPDDPMEGSVGSDARVEWSDEMDRVAVAKLHHERCEAHYMVVSILLDSSAFADSPGEARPDYTASSDIYHAQGAARVAAAAGVGVGLAANGVQLVINDAARGDARATILVGLLVIGALMLSVWVLSRVRERSFGVSATRLGHGLRHLYSREPELLSELCAEVG